MSGGSAATPRAGGGRRLPIGLDHRYRLPGPRYRRGVGADPARHRSDEPVDAELMDKAGAHGAHGVVLMDKAGWHTAGALVVPDNLSLVFLPPPVQARGRLYSPELNPIERLWLHLKTIACRTASSAPPTRSSTADARRRTGCSPKPVASARCLPTLGSHRAAINQVGISRQIVYRNTIPGALPCSLNPRGKVRGVRGR